MNSDTLLKERDKLKLIMLINSERYDDVLKILDKVKTHHAGTSKTKDKRFVIREIVRNILDTGIDSAKKFYHAGKLFCDKENDNAKEIGISLIWRGYDYNPEIVKQILLKISDDPNWEVREYAGNALADTLYYHNEFLTDLKEWRSHTSENVRRAVVFSALAFRDEKNYKKAFTLLSKLMKDRSVYVRKNLGPFILGSLFGGKFPEETTDFLKKSGKSKDPYVKWNVIMAFNNSFGKNHPDKAFDVLRMFKDDNDIRVIRAMRSTLNFLGKHHTEKTKWFIEKYYMDKMKH
ncbi:MAG: HEAT repeat domain-containing protein [Ignavibacteria bacterium]|nr:HEAT repeat domain-containing protein [Ignavibacteria bacterium]